MLVQRPDSSYARILCCNIVFYALQDHTLCCPWRDPDYDQLHKIWLLKDYLSKKFTDVSTPQQNISIDKSLRYFTDRLATKQYLPQQAWNIWGQTV